MVVAGSRGARLALLFILAGAAAVSAQASPTPSARTLLYVDQEPDGSLTADQLLMISRSVLVALRSGVPGLQIAELPSGSLSPASADLLAQQASEAGAVFWIWLHASADSSTLSFRARGYDRSSLQTAFDQSIQREGGFSAASLGSETWADLVDLLRPKLPPASVPPTAVSSQPRKAAVTVHAEPGTVITGPRGTRATADSSGVARLELAAPAEYTFRSTRLGFYAETDRLFLSEDQDLVLHQASASRWALDASMLQMAYPGVDVSYLIVPNWIYAKLGLTTYLLGLAFSDTQVVTSNPLTNIVLQAGSYLRREDVVFRPYVNLGVFVRFVHDPGTLVGIDPLSWGGLQASLGTEIGSNPRGRLFVEFQPMLYVTNLPNLLEAALVGSGNSGDEPTGWLFGSNAALDLLCFRVGYRWML